MTGPCGFTATATPAGVRRCIIDLENKITEEHALSKLLQKAPGSEWTQIIHSYYTQRLAHSGWEEIIVIVSRGHYNKYQSESSERAMHKRERSITAFANKHKPYNGRLVFPKEFGPDIEDDSVKVRVVNKDADLALVESWTPDYAIVTKDSDFHTFFLDSGNVPQIISTRDGYENKTSSFHPIFRDLFSRVLGAAVYNRDYNFHEGRRDLVKAFKKYACKQLNLGCSKTRMSQILQHGDELMSDAEPLRELVSVCGSTQFGTEIDRGVVERWVDSMVEGNGNSEIIDAVRTQLSFQNGLNVPGMRNRPFSDLELFMDGSLSLSNALNMNRATRIPPNMAPHRIIDRRDHVKAPTVMSFELESDDEEFYAPFFGNNQYALTDEQCNVQQQDKKRPEGSAPITVQSQKSKGKRKKVASSTQALKKYKGPAAKVRLGRVSASQPEKEADTSKGPKRSYTQNPTVDRKKTFKNESIGLTGNKPRSRMVNIGALPADKRPLFEYIHRITRERYDTYSRALHNDTARVDTLIRLYSAENHKSSMDDIGDELKTYLGNWSGFSTLDFLVRENFAENFINNCKVACGKLGKDLYSWMMEKSEISREAKSQVLESFTAYAEGGDQVEFIETVLNMCGRSEKKRMVKVCNILKTSPSDIIGIRSRAATEHPSWTQYTIIPNYSASPYAILLSSHVLREIFRKLNGTEEMWAKDVLYDTADSDQRTWLYGRNNMRLDVRMQYVLQDEVYNEDERLRELVSYFLGDTISQRMAKRALRSTHIHRFQFVCTQGMVKLLEFTHDFGTLSASGNLDDVLRTRQQNKQKNINPNNALGKMVNRQSTLYIEDLCNMYGRNEVREKVLQHPIVFADPGDDEVRFCVVYPWRRKLLEGRVYLLERHFVVSKQNIRDHGLEWQEFVESIACGVDAERGSEAQYLAMRAMSSGYQHKLTENQDCLVRKTLAKQKCEAMVVNLIRREVQGSYKYSADPTIMFGNGDWKPTRGRSSQLHTALRKLLARHFFVLYIDEHNSSQKCFNCREQLQDFPVDGFPNRKHLVCPFCSSQHAINIPLIQQRDQQALRSMVRSLLDYLFIGRVHPVHTPPEWKRKNRKL